MISAYHNIRDESETVIKHCMKCDLGTLTNESSVLFSPRKKQYEEKSNSFLKHAACIFKVFSFSFQDLKERFVCTARKEKRHQRRRLKIKKSAGHSFPLLRSPA